EEWRPWLARFAACVARACDAADGGNRWPTMAAALPSAYGSRSVEWAWSSDDPTRGQPGGPSRLSFTISNLASVAQAAQGTQSAVSPVRVVLTSVAGTDGAGSTSGASAEMRIEPQQTV